MSARSEEQDQSEPTVEGAMLGGEVILNPTGASLGPGFVYWGEQFGIRAGVAISLLRGKMEVEGTSADADQTVVAWGGDLLLGLPSGRAKPYASLGILMSSTKQEQGDGEQTVTSELSSTDLNVGVGVDFAAAENLVVGIGLLRVGYILDGSLKIESAEAELSGYALGLLSSFSVRYVF